jgi:hypothetical protein
VAATALPATGMRSDDSDAEVGGEGAVE